MKAIPKGHRPVVFVLSQSQAEELRAIYHVHGRNSELITYMQTKMEQAASGPIQSNVTFAHQEQEDEYRPLYRRNAPSKGQKQRRG